MLIQPYQNSVVSISWICAVNSYGYNKLAEMLLLCLPVNKLVQNRTIFCQEKWDNFKVILLPMFLRMAPTQLTLPPVNLLD